MQLFTATMDQIETPLQIYALILCYANSNVKKCKVAMMAWSENELITGGGDFYFYSYIFLLVGYFIFLFKLEHWKKTLIKNYIFD